MSRKSLCYNRGMEVLSPVKFRRIGAIVVRVIWTGILVGCAIFFFDPFMKIMRGEKLGHNNDKFDVLIVGCMGLLAFLIIWSIYKFCITAFSRITIYKDVLRDKYIKVVRTTDDDGDTHESYYYYLYFDQVFGRFKKATEVTKNCYHDTVIGKEYYIGIVHGRQNMKVYAAEAYSLSAAAERDLVTDAETLGKRTHWRWQAPEEKPVVNDGGVKRITPEQVAADAYTYWSPVENKAGKGAKIVKIVFAVITMVLVFISPMVFMGGRMSPQKILTIVASLVFSYSPLILIFFLLTRFTNRGFRNKKKEILAGHYKVILDTVAVTEEHDMANFSYRMIHEQMPVRLASGHTLNLSRAKFNNVRPGDHLYIVYLESGNPYDDNNIVAVYQEKLGKLDFGFEVTWAS